MIVFDNTWILAPGFVYVLKDTPNAGQMVGTIVRVGSNVNPYRVGDQIVFRAGQCINCNEPNHVLISIADIGAYKR